MKEKNVTKISISTFFLILAIIAIIVMGLFIYKLNNEKVKADEKAARLQKQVNNLNSTVKDLQGKINNISETINSNNSSNKDNNTETFTDEQVKTALANYLELKAHLNCNGLLNKLTEKGELNYDWNKATLTNDGRYITDIKYSDYRNAMLKYVSKNEFEKNWNSYYSQDNNGNLIDVNGGGGLRVYTINSITKNSDSTYSANTTVTIDYSDDSKEDENFIFTITSYNGNCVIDSIK